MQRKIHNQTLFVAALTVYLGLALVGAPPQILAQQSKSVAVQTDLPEKQNLADDKVSSEAEALLAKEFFVKSVAEFLKDLETLSKIQKFSPNAPFDKPFRFNDEIFVDKSDSLRTIRGKGSSDSNKWLATAFRKFEEHLIAEFDRNARLFVYRDNLQFEGARQTVKAELDSTALTIQTAFDAVSAEQAANLAETYNQVFARGAASENARKAFYENTGASFENNQIFIVTRLPRANLDSLLKANEKAN